MNFEPPGAGASNQNLGTGPDTERPWTQTQPAPIPSGRALGVPTSATGAEEAELQPPRARALARPLREHGRKRLAPFRWMREEQHAAELRVYLDAENSYADKILTHLGALPRALFGEFMTRLPQEEISEQYRQGDIVHYERKRKDLDYSLFCLRPAEGSGPEIIFLNENELARGHPYFDIDAYALNPEPFPTKVAYGVDYSGDQHLVLRVKEIAGGIIYPESVPDVDEFEWTTASDALVYTVLDQEHRTAQVKLHRFGDDAANDTVLLEEEDAAFSFEMSLTRDERHIIIESSSLDSSDAYLVDRADPRNGIRKVWSRDRGALAELDACNGRVFVHTNADGAFNFKILTANDNGTGQLEFEELLVHDPAFYREAMLAFDNHLVVVSRIEGKRKLEIVDLRDHSRRIVDVGDESYSLEVTADENPHGSAKEVLCELGSFIRPVTRLKIGLHNGAAAVSPHQETDERLDLDAYGSKVLWVRSRDGAGIPLSLHFRRDFAVASEPRPVFLMGYGCYGDAYDPDPKNGTYLRSLMNRGILVAVAHVRGGSELGIPWYHAARQATRRVSIDDFVDCANYLIETRISASDRLAAYGRSAGGMLLAVANERPELFHVLAFEVPFVDCLNSLLDPNVPLSVRERFIYGDPNDSEAYAWIREYSPADNVRRQRYPHMYIQTGENDPWVSVEEPAVLAAMLRRYNIGSNEIVLRTHWDEGHRGASARRELLQQKAELFAFVLDKLRCNEYAPPGPN